MINDIEKEIKLIEEIIEDVKNGSWIYAKEKWNTILGSIIDNIGLNYPLNKPFNEVDEQELGESENILALVDYLCNIREQIKYKRLVIEANREQDAMGYDPIYDFGDREQSVINPYLDVSGRFAVEPYSHYGSNYMEREKGLHDLYKVCRIIETDDESDMNIIIQLHKSPRADYYSYTYDDFSMAGSFDEIAEELDRAKVPESTRKELKKLRDLNNFQTTIGS